MTDYKEIAEKKVLERNQHLKKEWLVPEDRLPTDRDVMAFPNGGGFLSEEELEITQSDMPTLFSSIKSKKWSSYKVTKAFCHRSQIAQQLTNCLTEIFYDEALQTAIDLDTYYDSTGHLKGAFHGLPISLKDSTNLKGHPTTIGFVGYCYDPKGGFTYDSALAEILRREGAVFYCKTNIPQAMMMVETTNNVYGTTTNPLNRDLSAGGSSGGAGAQAALRGSCVDMGSDIAGSIRIPAAFQGLYSLKPTSGRIPTYGTRSGMPGQETVAAVNGPISADLTSVEWFTRNLVNVDPSTVDPKVAYIPWKTVSLPHKLKIAILEDDGYVRPTPPIIRGIRKVKEVLERAGHTVVDWNPAEHAALNALGMKFYVADGGKHIIEAAAKSGEDVFPNMINFANRKELTVSELWKLQAERTVKAAEFLQRWEDTGIDALIMPVAPHAAPAHGKFGHYFGYSVVGSVLDVSAGTFPISYVDEAIDKKDPDYKPRNADDKYVYDNYDAAYAHGGSISAQVLCRKQEDEKVIEILKVVSSLLKGEGHSRQYYS